MSQAQEPVTFWRAHCSTEHFDFEAYGSTEQEARLLLEKGFGRHASQCGISRNWWKGPDNSGDDYYGISVEPVQMDGCYRDGSLLTTMRE